MEVSLPLRLPPLQRVSSSHPSTSLLPTFQSSALNRYSVRPGLETYLNGKVFYIDLINPKKDEIDIGIRRLGGKTVAFLSNAVSHVVVDDTKHLDPSTTRPSHAKGDKQRKLGACGSGGTGNRRRLLLCQGVETTSVVTDPSTIITGNSFLSTCKQLKIKTVPAYNMELLFERCFIVNTSLHLPSLSISGQSPHMTNINLINNNIIASNRKNIHISTVDTRPYEICIHAQDQQCKSLRHRMNEIPSYCGFVPLAAMPFVNADERLHLQKLVNEEHATAKRAKTVHTNKDRNSNSDNNIQTIKNNLKIKNDINNSIDNGSTNYNKEWPSLDANPLGAKGAGLRGQADKPIISHRKRETPLPLPPQAAAVAATTATTTVCHPKEGRDKTVVAKDEEVIGITAQCPSPPLPNDNKQRKRLYETNIEKNKENDEGVRPGMIHGGGWCEVCREAYDDYQHHVASTYHIKRVCEPGDPHCRTAVVPFIDLLTQLLEEDIGKRFIKRQKHKQNRI